MTLQELLGEELFQQVQARLDEVNANEPDKLKHVRFADLSEGNYVSKQKYDAEVATSQGKDSEIANYKQAIADLQKANKGNEDIQHRITQLETENAQLKAAQEESEMKYAFDVLLIDAGVTDRDEREFLAFKYEKKLKEEGKTLELDENKHIKSGDEILKELSTQFPAKFTNKANSGDCYVPLENNGLPHSYSDKSVTKEQFRNMTYEERVALKQSNENLYKQLVK